MPRADVPETYFYHSFPRKFFGKTEEITKGLAILESVIESGLLLTPETWEAREQLAEGGLSLPLHVEQKRICFTELSPNYLKEHSSVFGHFALEFGIIELRQLGAIPVFYIPSDERSEYLEGVGTALLNRLGDIQVFFENLEKFEEYLTNISQSNKSNKLKLSPRGRPPIKQLECTVGAAEELIGGFKRPGISYGLYIGAVQFLGGFFYKTENFKYNDLLDYYRQREWRITANMEKDGIKVDRPLKDTEKTRLLEIDESFFGKEREFRTGVYRIVDQCKLFSEFKDRHVLDFANRIIVPKRALKDARSLIANAGLNIEVISINRLDNILTRALSVFQE
jgi:hypothetical protein